MRFAAALFWQRPLWQQVQAAGGDYLLLVKNTQSALPEASALLFDPPPVLARRPWADLRTTRTIATGHGRRPEVRELWASTDLTTDLDWPGVAQVFRIERTWRGHGQPNRALHYGITSLSPPAGPPDRRLALKRGHWVIDNRLPWRKAVTLGEEARLIHAGQGPTVLALLREAAITLLHHQGVWPVASRLRAYSPQPEAAIALGIGPLIIDA